MKPLIIVVFLSVAIGVLAGFSTAHDCVSDATTAAHDRGYIFGVNETTQRFKEATK